MKPKSAAKTAWDETTRKVVSDTALRRGLNVSLINGRYLTREDMDKQHELAQKAIAHMRKRRRRYEHKQRIKAWFVNLFSKLKKPPD